MQAISYSFENTAVRTLGTAETPLFVALDVCNALGYQKARNAVSQHVDPEDIFKVEIDTDGGRQSVNCVNESGLYALIFGSKLESAKRFKRWVTSEVLPAIRKTGKYECPLSPETLTEAHSYAIMSAVAKRAKSCGAHYQTIYRALKARYQVTKYTHIRESDFEDAMRFIQTVDLRVPEAVPEESPFDENGRCKLCGLRPVPSGSLVLDARDADRLLTWVYYWRYLFRAPLHLFAEFLGRVGSPYAGAFHEAVADPYMGFLEDILRKNGYDVRQLKCYQYFIAHNA